MNTAFAIKHFPLKDETHFIFLKNHLENGLKLSFIFVYLFKRENKIRNKTLV